MSRLPLLLLVLLAVACKPPPEAPTELSELTAYLFREFETEDPEVLSVGMENLQVYFSGVDLTVDYKDLSYTPATLAEADIEGIVHPDRDPAQCLPVAVVTPSAFLPASHADVIILHDQTPVEPNSPNLYDRTFTDPTDPSCFPGQSCTLARSLNDILKENFLMTIPYEMHKDFRWVEMTVNDEETWGILGKSWCEEVAWGTDGSNVVYQSFSIDVFWPYGDGTGARYMSLWSEPEMPGVGDDAVQGTIRWGIQQMFEATEEYLAGDN